MITLFNYWHFIILGIIFLIFILTIIVAFKQENRKLIKSIIFSTFLISVLISGFAIVTVDKYTKIAKLYKLENKRILSIEKIIKSGIAKHDSKHEMRQVVFDI